MAGVSSTTVSHVINRTRAVNVVTAARVWEAIETLRFSPSTLARSLRMKSTLTIGVVSDYAGNPFFSEVVAGIEEVCFERNFSVFLSYSERDDAKEFQAVQNLVRRGVEGLIWHAVQPDAGVGEFLSQARLPVILFQRSLPVWNRDALVTDDAEGGRAVMAHLLGLGHRRIALITGETFPSHAARLREQGYRAALSSGGPGIDEALIRDGNYSFEGAYAATRDLLSLSEPPTAFFCISDRMALGSLSALQDAGLRVPHDVSLVGYDNLELLNYVRPRLTTVDHGGRESGGRLARRLLDRIKAPEMAAEQLVSAPRLLIRETSGPAPHMTKL
jgi:LacI family transcriptional regulator